MMTSSRPRDVGGSFASRRGHSSQLSISDPSHHVTEAIGTMYGDSDDDSGSDSRQETAPPELRRKERPLSFLASPAGGEQIAQAVASGVDVPDERLRLVRSTSDKSPLSLSTTATDNTNEVNPGIKKSQTLPARVSSKRGQSYEGGVSPGGLGGSPLSPTLSLRDVQQAESPQFPLADIDNPNAIAQELSNLQALRRMSMDVGNNKDPDLLPFQGMSLMAMPTIAPTGEDDEGDISRLLWVPAKVHPELAPDQFKNFLENRVKTIKRRSGDSMLSADSLERNSSGSLRRKKSMLSRQIDSSGGSAAEEYVDGAERLERKRSASGRATPELSLNELVKDPSRAVQKLAQETQEAGMEEDVPILPVAPGMGLRRSTRTTYRKGGSLRGERLPFSKRLAAREAEKEAGKELDQDQGIPPVPKLDGPPGHGLTRVQTEPMPAAENFSRPTRSVRRQQPFQRDVGSPISPASSAGTPATPTQHQDDSLIATSLPLRPSSSERPSTADSSRSTAPSIPQIVETPAPDEEDDEPLRASQPSRPFPQRSSSQKALQQHQNQQQPQQSEPQQQPPPRSSKRPSTPKSAQKSSSTPQAPQEPPSSSHGQTLNEMAQHPSPLPGGAAGRTDSLTFIPTLAADDRKSDKKNKEKEDGESSRSGWKWFRGEEREKKKKEKEEQAKKARSRTSAEKGHDNARLDVLQNSIDNALQKGRESLLLDRDAIDNKLHEERKKESSRKSGESKKEKDGFFGSIFGGKSKKGDKDSSSGRGKQRALSPEPPPRILRPDIDYHYTRFPIVEERAIYRMAHIKLANPRRSLLSQVLLSNFMYSYLAKVQAMHPQLNVPVSPQQKRLEEERKRREEEQQYLVEQQQMREQEMDQQDGEQSNFDQYNFEYHRSANQYGDTHQHDGSVDYVDDSQIYEYDHGSPQQESQNHNGNQNGGYQNEPKAQGGRPGSAGRQYQEYEQREPQQQHDGGRRRERDDDMW